MPQPRSRRDPPPAPTITSAMIAVALSVLREEAHAAQAGRVLANMVLKAAGPLA